MEMNRRQFASLIGFAAATTPALALARPPSTPCWKLTYGLKTSPITNLWGQSRVVRLDTDHRIIYRGDVRANFSHQAQLTSPDGRLYASWTLGIHGEEEPGQIMVMATSHDRGRTWSEPSPIVDRLPGKYADRVVVSTGVRKGDLIAYFGEWEYGQEGLDENGKLIKKSSRKGPRRVPTNHDQHLNTVTRATISKDRGKTWSEPTLIHPRIATYLHFIVGDEPNRPPRAKGLGKGGRYGYPYLHLMDDDAFVIYSVGKEDIGIARFKLQDLG